MSNDKIPPYPPDVAQLIEAEQVRPGLPSALKERMFGGIAVTLGLPHGGPGGPDGGESGDPAGGGGDTGAAPGSAPPGSAPPAGAGLDQAAASIAGQATTSIASGGVVASVSAAKGAGLLALVAKPAIVVAFAVGATAGSVTTYVAVSPPIVEAPAARVEAGQARLTPRPALVPANPTKPAKPEPAVTAALDPSVVAPAAPRSRRASPLIAKRRPVATASSQPTTLSAERNLIMMARTALSRGAAAAALNALAEHQRRYPRGQLAEERAALAVIALARAGQPQEARRTAERFRKRYPGSLLLPTVETALRQ